MTEKQTWKTGNVLNIPKKISNEPCFENPQVKELILESMWKIEKNFLRFMKIDKTDGNNPTTFTSGYFNKYLGHGKIGIYLKELLFIKVKNHQKGSHSCKWVINKGKWNKLVEQMSYQYPNHQKWGELFESSFWRDGVFVNDGIGDGSIKFNKKDGRLHSSATWIRSDSRNFILKKKGFVFDYDISTAVQSVILSKAKWNLKFEEEKAIGLQKYINDKNLYRNHLSQLFLIDKDLAKKMITGLTYSPKLKKYMINCDHSYKPFYQEFLSETQIDLLKNDELLNEFVSSVRYCWSMIVEINKNTNEENLDLSDDILSDYSFGDFDIIPDELLNENEKQFCSNSSSRSKFYFEAETSIIELVRFNLMKEGINSIPIFDGFVSDKPIDLIQVTNLIKDTLEMEIKFELSLI